MSLKQQTTLIITASLLVLLTLLGLVVRFSVLRSFRLIEDNDISNHVRRAENNIDAQLDNLLAVLGDWAHWDDTRDYATGDYDDYLADNMMDSSFTNLELNFMWLGDAAGSPLFSKMVSLETGQEIPVPDSLTSYIATHPALTTHPTITSEIKGIIILPEGPMIVVSSPILDSFEEGPIAGTMMMGALMNESWQQSLSDDLRLPVQLFRWDDPALPAAAAAAREALLAGGTTVATPLDENTIAGFGLLRDIDGNPALMMEVTQPRDIFRAGWNSLSWFFGMATVLSLMMIIGMVIILDWRVLSRISVMNTHLADVTETHNWSRQLTVSGSDELSNLMRSFNSMLASIQKSDAALREAHDELEQRVKDRTADLQTALDEKVVLLQEVHHRVKNNLQVISSLLSLQAATISDEQTLTALNDSQARVRAMALVHEKLYQSTDLSRINFKPYLESLVSYLYQLYWKRQGRVSFSVRADDVVLGVDVAIPCGLLVNELVANSLKHAFPNGTDNAMIEIRFVDKGDTYELSVRDNGVGLPAEFDISRSRSLGLQLVQTLTQQNRGVLTVSAEGGTAFTVTFPSKANHS